MLGLPGLQWATETPSQTGVILITALGAVIGWGVGAILVRTKK
jgi:hypothetical protein